MDSQANNMHAVVEIDRLHADIGARQRAMLRHILTADRQRVWQADGCRNMAEWLAGRLGISKWAAHRWVDAAQALEGLPVISQAFATGALSLDKTLELTRFATPETEAKLVPWARKVMPVTIRKKADLAVRETLEDVVEIDRCRYLNFWSAFEGRGIGFAGLLPPAEGAAVIAAIDRIAGSLPSSPEDEPGGSPLSGSFDPLDARRADALVALCSQQIANDQDADRATVVVHADLETLMTGNGGCDLESGQILHPEVVRRMSCDARLQTVINGSDGQAVGIGRLSRTVPRWMMRQLRYRDSGCVFPGCGTKRFLKAHHIHWWIDGGPTDLDNLVLLCSLHHKLVHEYGWTVALGELGLPEWFRPTGERFDPGIAVPSDDGGRAPPREKPLAKSFL
jgi:hypothetical protein